MRLGNDLVSTYLTLRFDGMHFTFYVAFYQLPGENVTKKYCKNFPRETLGAWLAREYG